MSDDEKKEVDGGMGLGGKVGLGVSEELQEKVRAEVRAMNRAQWEKAHGHNPNIFTKIWRRLFR